MSIKKSTMKKEKEKKQNKKIYFGNKIHSRGSLKMRKQTEIREGLTTELSTFTACPICSCITENISKCFNFIAKQKMCSVRI